MREILYKYNTRGLYQTEDDTTFGGETNLKLVIEPHKFSIAVGGETLRSTAYEGGAVVASRNGGAAFYDHTGALLAKAAESDANYKEIYLRWQPDSLSVQFGQAEQVDYYPHCDGEYDRWGTEWVAQRTVTLHLKDNTVTVE